jgi:hypothetical protein
MKGGKGEPQSSACERRKLPPPIEAVSFSRFHYIKGWASRLSVAVLRCKTRGLHGVPVECELTSVTLNWVCAAEIRGRHDPQGFERRAQ